MFVLQGSRFAMARAPATERKAYCASASAALYPSNQILIRFRCLNKLQLDFVFLEVVSLDHCLDQLFFFVMFMSTVNARKMHGKRNSWHSEWWPVKLILWLGFTAISFFAPSPLVQLYGQSPADQSLVFSYNLLMSSL